MLHRPVVNAGMRKRQQVQMERFVTLPTLLPLRLYRPVVTEMLPFTRRPEIEMAVRKHRQQVPGECILRISSFVRHVNPENATFFA